jgi:cystathionine gamma-synthase
MSRTISTFTSLVSEIDTEIAFAKYSVIMGDIGTDSQSWMPPMTPQALPLGKANMFPSDDPHVSKMTNRDERKWQLTTEIQSVSVSLPTWDSVIGLSRKEDWVMDKLACSYPR